MSGAVLPQHARKTHGLGQSDAVDMQLPVIVGTLSSSQSITADAEVDWGAGGAVTNDRKTFSFDEDDSPGLLIKRDGTYAVFSTVYCAGGDSSTERSAIPRFGAYSDGPGATSVIGEGQNHFYMANLAEQLFGLGDIPKPNLSFIGMHTFLDVDPTDPWRIVILCDHNGTNYTVQFAKMIVARVYGATGEPPLPPTA